MSNLIFLISAPRSGSSLMQQTINSHPSVYSLPEPWLMLPLVYLIKDDDEGKSCFNQKYAKINLDRFFSLSPGSQKNFKNRIKKLALDTYKEFLPNESFNFFLDKTPRYYHIIEELLDWFPAAKFILLTRNPVAVFCSIMEHNFSGNINWLQNADRFHDISTAPKKICEFKTYDQILFIRYEDLIENTEKTTDLIFRYLGLKIDHNLKRGYYEIKGVFQNTESIDTKSIKKHKKPVKDYVDVWKSAINTSSKKLLLLEYIEYLGEETFIKLGYSSQSIKQEVLNIKVAWNPIKVPFKLITNNYGIGLTLKEQLILALLLKLLPND